jgi:peroxiredoxin 2/4
MATRTLHVGEPAPDFNLKGVINSSEPEDFKLADYRGRWVVLFFYPLDFSIVCPTEVKEFSQRFDEFDQFDAAVFGVSTQNIDSHKKWIEKLGEIRYPLLADPDYAASEAYNTLIPAEGVALRGTFIIDPRGVLRYALYHDNAIGRSVTETLRVLAALRTGEMCPAEWQPGDPTLTFRDSDTLL